VTVGDTDVTAVFVQVDPATHGMLTRSSGERQYEADFPPFTPLAEPLPVTNPIVELQTLIVELADAWTAGTTPAVEDPFSP